MARAWVVGRRFEVDFSQGVAPSRAQPFDGGSSCQGALPFQGTEILNAQHGYLDPKL